MDDSSPRGANVYVTGTSDSGKSTLMWECYTKRAPRIVTIEIVDETQKRDPSARLVFGWTETKAMMAECARRESWHIVARLEREEVERLFRVLVPPVSRRGAVGFGRAVGGVVVACGELQKIAPKSLPEDHPVKDGYLRGRHHWLTIHGATQHGADVNPSCRMQVKHAVFLRQTDKLGLEAVARTANSELARIVEELPEFHSLTWVKHEGRAYLRDDKYHQYDVLNHRGVSLLNAAGSKSLTASVGDQSPGLSSGVALSAGTTARSGRTAKKRQRRT